MGELSEGQAAEVRGFSGQWVPVVLHKAIPGGFLVTSIENRKAILAGTSTAAPIGFKSRNIRALQQEPNKP